MNQILINEMKKENIYTYCKGFFNFKPTDYQLDFMNDCINSKRVVAVFCRQSGKSESTSKVAILHARIKPNITILIFAPTDRQTGLIAEKISRTLNEMRRVANISSFKIDRQSQREFFFSNGSKIVCETTGDKGETIRGYTANIIILEEAGSIKDSIIHSVILPMGATTDATIIKIGTPRGMNHFYESFLNPEYKVHLIKWTRAVEQGILSKSYVDEMLTSLPTDRFRTEMEAEFIPDEDAYFNYDLIDKCIDKNIVEINKPEEKKIYYLGADIARMGQDSTCLMIIEKGEPSKVIKIIDIPKATLDFIIDKIIELHNTYNFTRMFLDETGLGAGVRDVLARQFNIYKHKQNYVVNTKKFNFNDLVIGIRFTIQSKIDIFSNLKVLMQQGKIKFPDNHKLVSQLRDFRYETTDSGNIKLHHSEYGFDDYPDSLALACQGLKENQFIMDW